jgi:hypothetical protein
MSRCLPCCVHVGKIFAFNWHLFIAEVQHDFHGSHWRSVANLVTLEITTHIFLSAKSFQLVLTREETYTPVWSTHRLRSRSLGLRASVIGLGIHFLHIKIQCCTAACDMTLHGLYVSRDVSGMSYIMASTFYVIRQFFILKFRTIWCKMQFHFMSN